MVEEQWGTSHAQIDAIQIECAQRRGLARLHELEHFAAFGALARVESQTLDLLILRDELGDEGAHCLVEQLTEKLGGRRGAIALERRAQVHARHLGRAVETLQVELDLTRAARILRVHLLEIQVLERLVGAQRDGKHIHVLGPK